MAAVSLSGLSCGAVQDQYGNAQSGRAMFVYTRGTTTEVTVYLDEALTEPLTQPLATVNGLLPGYVLSGQSIDVVDQLTGALEQGEAVNATTVGGGGGAGDLLAANNLSDLVSASTARTNLGLGSAATDSASAFDAAGTATTAVATETTRAETAEALLAPKASPALTGTPTAPTASALTDSTQVATTAYADSAVAVETSRAETAEALLAPKASPTLTGTVTIPTATTGDNTTKAASTAFVTTAVATETSRAETAEALLAPLASPALTGNPTASTQAQNNNSTRVATTAYADRAALAVEGLPLALTGATSATRYVGGTASVAPTTGTFVVGDYVITQSGTIYICTSAGSPGTWTQITGSGGSVSSVFTRTGAVVASSGDYTVAQVTGAAPLASPTLTGTPAAPTASAGTNTTQVATTAFVIAELGLPIALTGATAATRDVGGTTSGAPSTGSFLKGDVVVDQTGAIWICTTAGSPGTWTSVTNGLAALASPTFTGTPAAPTATAGTNTTQVATTAFVAASFAPLASPALTGTPTVPTATAGTNTTQAASTAFVATSFAPLASPTLTGTPAAPTASAGTSTTQLATTAFTQTAIATPLVQSTTSGSTFAITSTDSLAKLTALAAACTVSVSGTPNDGQKMTFRAKDNGTSRVITFSSSNFAVSGVTGTSLTLTTVANKTHTAEFIYDSVLGKYVEFALDTVGY